MSSSDLNELREAFQRAQRELDKMQQILNRVSKPQTQTDASSRISVGIPPVPRHATEYSKLSVLKSAAPKADNPYTDAFSFMSTASSTYAAHRHVGGHETDEDSD